MEDSSSGVPDSLEEFISSFLLLEGTPEDSLPSSLAVRPPG